MEFISVESLLNAYQGSSNRNHKKLSVFKIYEILIELKNERESGYQGAAYNCFIVKDLNIREIFAPAFKDRLVQRLLCDRLMQSIDKAFIDDSFANRKNKGSYAAVKRGQ